MEERVRFSWIQVVIILFVFGISARVLAPKLSQAGSEKKINVLIEAIGQMRTGINLYKIQHNGNLPDFRSFENFERSMTEAGVDFEPYIKNIPINPFNGMGTVRFDGQQAGCDMAGWRFDTKTGKFQADSFGYSNL